MASVLCFDIAIKTLAFCHMRTHENKQELVAWELVNLLNTDGTPVITKQTCYGCKSKATHENQSCARHTPKPALKYKKIPAVKALREIALQHEPALKKTLTKEELLTVLRKYYTLPLEVPKPQKTANIDLSFLHDQMRALVSKHKAEWSTVKEICLENQPVFKNPQMKTVQMMLFATLRDLLQPNPPPIRLVHAGVKVKGAKDYSERKKGSEDRVVSSRSSIEDPYDLYNKVYNVAKKKDDLADAFCMAIDALKRP